MRRLLTVLLFPGPAGEATHHPQAARPEIRPAERARHAADSSVVTLRRGAGLMAI